ncbi:putative WD-40 repeat protein [Frankia canadensis]|uniref:Putative WD-40 repeat protein n=2 Tax=Frankia canadensis TaxID=1836972 RepID=A0A2I2KKP6_9ACTN|nr:putative WD-40 repeat protein [Frankia canadensis]SOU53507.1 putative WD-40 repeat protein [Frankia canadensis]
MSKPGGGPAFSRLLTLWHAYRMALQSVNASGVPEAGTHAWTKCDVAIFNEGTDQGWAEWLAWVLEEVGLKIWLRNWDSVAGTQQTEQVQHVLSGARHVAAVVSPATLAAMSARPEWRAAMDTDPDGRRRRLLVIRVEECEPPALLGQVRPIDLFGLAEEAARGHLLAAFEAVDSGRAKPRDAPPFPGGPGPADGPGQNGGSRSGAARDVKPPPGTAEEVSDTGATGATGPTGAAPREARGGGRRRRRRAPRHPRWSARAVVALAAGLVVALGAGAGALHGATARQGGGDHDADRSAAAPDHPRRPAPAPAPATAATTAATTAPPPLDVTSRGGSPWTAGTSPGASGLRLVGQVVSRSGRPAIALALLAGGTSLVTADAGGSAQQWALLAGAGPASPTGRSLSCEKGRGASAEVSASGLSRAQDPPRWSIDGTDRVPRISFPASCDRVVDIESDNIARSWAVTGDGGARPVPLPLTAEVRAAVGGVQWYTFASAGALFAASVSDGSVLLVDTAHRAFIGSSLRGPTGPVFALAWSSDGRTLAVGGADGAVQLWNVADPASPRLLGTPLNGGTGAVYDLAWFPDGAMLAAAGADGTVRVWNTVNRERVGNPTVFGSDGHGAACALSVDADSRTLAGGYLDGAVRLWSRA